MSKDNVVDLEQERESRNYDQWEREAAKESGIDAEDFTGDDFQDWVYQMLEEFMPPEARVPWPKR